MPDLRSRFFIKQFLRFFKLKGDIIMTAKRKIEVFSAGCPVCMETIELVNRVACPSCEVSVLDMNQAAVAQRAKELGIRSVPAVVIDGKLADCCAGRRPQEAVAGGRIGPTRLGADSGRSEGVQGRRESKQIAA